MCVLSVSTTKLINIYIARKPKEWGRGRCSVEAQQKRTPNAYSFYLNTAPGFPANGKPWRAFSRWGYFLARRPLQQRQAPLPKYYPFQGWQAGEHLANGILVRIYYILKQEPRGRGWWWGNRIFVGYSRCQQTFFFSFFFFSNLRGFGSAIEWMRVASESELELWPEPSRGLSVKLSLIRFYPFFLLYVFSLSLLAPRSVWSPLMCKRI